MRSIIITGANSGIGFECAVQTARLAADDQIILACRNLESGSRAIEEIKRRTGHRNLVCLPLDLASLESIRNFKSSFAKQKHNKIRALINNAGIQNTGQTQFTNDGFEITFGVNHLGPFYLTLLLSPFLERDASITFTASDTHDPLQKTGIEHPVYTSGENLAFPQEIL